MIRLVTPEQKSEGYLLKVYDTVIKMDYKVIALAAHGNYLVTESHRILT